MSACLLGDPAGRFSPTGSFFSSHQISFSVFLSWLDYCNALLAGSPQDFFDNI